MLEKYYKKNGDPRRKYRISNWRLNSKKVPEDDFLKLLEYFDLDSAVIFKWAGIVLMKTYPKDSSYINKIIPIEIMNISRS